MNIGNNIWFTYEPIPHTDSGLIYCEGPVKLAAKVTRSGYGKEFTIEYDGQKNEEIESILKQMDEWFFHTHIKDAEDNEF
ncbi:MAG: hypothetical protein H7122_15940 [Chitinophagaceae bacterium]|nr:hypothetical protein [Chitinophagaceae bacterium]